MALNAEFKRRVVEHALEHGCERAAEEFGLPNYRVRRYVSDAGQAADYALVHDAEKRARWVEQVAHRRLALLDRLLGLSEDTADLISDLHARMMHEAEARDIAHLATSIDKLMGRVHTTVRDLAPVDTQMSGGGGSWTPRELAEPVEDAPVLDFPSFFIDPTDGSVSNTRDDSDDVIVADEN